MGRHQRGILLFTNQLTVRNPANQRDSSTLGEPVPHLSISALGQTQPFDARWRTSAFDYKSEIIAVCVGKTLSSGLDLAVPVGPERAGAGPEEAGNAAIRVAQRMSGVTRALLQRWKFPLYPLRCGKLSSGTMPRGP